MDPRDLEAGATGNERSRGRSPIPTFLLLSFFLFIMTSRSGEEFLARRHYQVAVDSLQYQLSNYTAWMNGTESNFTLPETNPDIPPLLDALHIQERILNPFRESYYPNITGYVRGDAQFYNITPIALENDDLNSDSHLDSGSSKVSIPWKSLAEKYVLGVNVTEVVERSSSWNWTGSNKMVMTLHEKKPLMSLNGGIDVEDLLVVHARMEFTDETTQDTLRLDMDGVHFLSQGSIVGLVEPHGQNLDIRLIPSVVPRDRMNATASIITPELEHRISKLKSLIHDGLIDNDSINESPKSTCPFTFYAQLQPVPIPEHLMEELESELQHPTGISTVKPPMMVLNAVLMSKECGILYHVTSTQGMRSQTFFNKMTSYGGLSAMIYLISLTLFSRQVERSRTASGISRVSRWTFLTHATIDAVCFAGHITFAILSEGRASLSLMATAFLSCLLFVQEAQFSALVFQIQGTESPPSPTPISPPPAAAAAAETTGQRTTTTGPTSDVPPTQPRQNTNDNDPNSSFFRFFIHHIRTDPQARLWIILFLFLTVLVRVILSPTLSLIFVAATYSFIWLPQIWRSARRGRTSGLAGEYVFGTSVCRLLGALYFLACPYNVLDIEPKEWAYWLVVVVMLQACVVMLQEMIGPSFFLPAKFAATKIYDYHPALPVPDSEAPGGSLGDCSICMDAIYVDSLIRQQEEEKNKNGDGIDKKEKEKEKEKEKGGVRKGSASASASGLLSVMQKGVGGSSRRREYSLAPCHHLFHTECLEKWLAIKNICPQCRRPLPPL